MRRHLPPLTALRAFEAAARHRSFTRASEELGVTQGAISRQIRALEAFLDVVLFRRLIRQVELTEAGERYRAVAARAFEEIERATMQLKGGVKRRVLNISVLPTMSSFWLMPRLASFAQSMREADIRIVNSIEPVDFQSRTIDAAIRAGRLPGEVFAADRPRIELEMVTDWRGVRADYLFPDMLVPICSPALIAGRRLDAVAALQQFRLIHVTTRRYAWPDWLKAHRAEFDCDSNALYFGHFFMAMEAARRGQGIAIVPTILLRHYEGAADVVCPFPPDLPSAGGYYFLFRASQAGDPALQKLRCWLKEEATREERALAEMAAAPLRMRA
jgi:LysR family glycine cleavage system transcriptional activator